MEDKTDTQEAGNSNLEGTYIVIFTDNKYYN